MHAAFNKQGLDPQPTTPEGFAAFIHNDLATNIRIAKFAAIKIE